MNHVLNKDTLLMLEFQQGDVDAYVRLHEKYFEKLIYFTRGFGLIITKEVAEDIVQDTFAKVYTHKDYYEPIGQFSTWLYTIAGNFARSEIRKFRRRKTQSLTKLVEVEPGVQKVFVLQDTIDPNAINPAEVRDYTSALQQIDEYSKEGGSHFTALFLKDMQGLGYDAISKILDIPLGTVKSRISRGREALRQRIDRDFTM